MKNMNNVRYRFAVVGMCAMLGVGFIACADAPEDDEFVDIPDTLQANAVTYGTWVNMGVDFGPCGIRPSTCTVGQQVSAHSGPGTAGGCYIYQCQNLGHWVNMGVDFGPCGVLPSTCTVGQQVSAHSGPGTAGGCYIYQCK